jgi:hypothetical protein
MSQQFIILVSRQGQTAAATSQHTCRIFKTSPLKTVMNVVTGLTAAQESTDGRHVRE